MSDRPEVLRAVGEWVAKAEEDFKAAGLMSHEQDCPPAVIAFHAQQCSEKYLKALLTLRSIPFPKTHALLLLRRLVPSEIGIAVSDQDLARLSRYAVDTRYPMRSEPVNRDDAQNAVAIARNLRQAVRKLLPGGE